MSRRDSNVRLTIVVPHLRADGPFEDTLISILENRPAKAEVVVAHDGSYSDPFDLSDEVRFVTAGSASMPELIGAAAAQAAGRYVHVIANGVRATAGWVDSALELLQQDAIGQVAPLAVSRIDDSIIAAGWTGGWLAPTVPVAQGQTKLGRRDAVRLQGACLAASFWNRDLLRQLTTAYAAPQAAAAQYAWSQMLRQQGWRVALASDSVVLAEAGMLGLEPGFGKARIESELQRQLADQSLVSATLQCGMAAVGSILRPNRWGQCAGQLLGSLLPRRHPLDLSQVSTPADLIEEAATLPMRASEESWSRRAA